MSILSSLKRRISEHVTAGSPPRHTAAVGRAHAAFAQAYPAWAESLFDMHFLTTRAAPILAEYARSGDTGAALGLARTWVDQLAASPALRERHIREVVPVAEQFLRLLDAELAKPNTRAQPAGSNPVARTTGAN